MSPTPRGMTDTPTLEDGPPLKRRKAEAGAVHHIDALHVSELTSHDGKGLGGRPISPPSPSRRGHTARLAALTPEEAAKAWDAETLDDASHDIHMATRFIRSPIRLTRVQDLAPRQNVDTIALKDILGDVMIKECWNFNFLFDIDFVMRQFDRDVRDMVKVKLVHGFWRKDDPRRIHLLDSAKRYPNVELLDAYIPHPFGTHHSKMIILFRHDQLAHILIHTANMISSDWNNMTQAVWASPLLPLQLPPASDSPAICSRQTVHHHAIGTGQRFKVDLVRYVDAYGKRLRLLSAELAKYDFSSIQAAFIGSTPSRQKLAALDSRKHTSFGWVGLREILSEVPIAGSSDPNVTTTTPHVVIQVSSIATSTPAWHSHFQSILSHHRHHGACASREEVRLRLPRSSCSSTTTIPRPIFSLVFPTPHEIRTSLDGYDAGHSIHMRTQSSQQRKQLAHLKPLLCRWSNTRVASTTPASAAAAAAPPPPTREAHRGPAAPHIKTYIRFRDQQQQDQIDWAMITSANLSTQAWGALPNQHGEVGIQSWETGVVLWPALFGGGGGSSRETWDGKGEGSEQQQQKKEKEEDEQEEEKETNSAIMVPVFGTDAPDSELAVHGPCGGAGAGAGQMVLTAAAAAAAATTTTTAVVVGFRMPYSLPLCPYAATDEPWCASCSYEELDWKGQRFGSSS